LPDNGRGSVAQTKLNTVDVPILMGTLGKAFGTFGAFVAGDEALVETLIQKARTYIYTTAIPPAIAEATRISLKILRAEDWRRSHLYDLLNRFKQFATDIGLPLMPSDTPIQPIQVGSAERAVVLSEALQNEGVLITAIRPPTVPKGSARLRLTFSASHTEKHLQHLFQALEKCFTSAR
jgi:8-amino-7-oxononanoate synthase